jgi:uncharacterized protein YndB with AHSA1/START domain
MATEKEELGKIERLNGYFQATLTRLIEHDQSTIWEMLTLPQHFSNWLAPGDIELVQGGRVTLNFADSGTVIDSEVTQCLPPSVLEYSWSHGDEPTRPVRWELHPAEGGTKLYLIIGIPEDEELARSCAGWEAHLLMMLAALEGEPIQFPFEQFQASRKAYRELVSHN